MSPHLSPSVTHTALQYYEIPASRLQTITMAGLTMAGIPLEAMGTRQGKKQVLTTCFTFSSFAREVLPPSLGGIGDPVHSEISQTSAEFIQRVESKSPLKAVRTRLGANAG